MAKLLIALLLAAPMSDEIKEALDVGCAKIAKKEATSPCKGVANVVQFKLALVGAKVDEQGWNYCVQVCEKTRAAK